MTTTNNTQAKEMTGFKMKYNPKTEAYEISIPAKQFELETMTDNLMKYDMNDHHTADSYTKEYPLCGDGFKQVLNKETGKKEKMFVPEECSFRVATSHSFIPMTAKGFEHLSLSLNVIARRKPVIERLAIKQEMKRQRELAEQIAKEQELKNRQITTEPQSQAPNGVFDKNAAMERLIRMVDEGKIKPNPQQEAKITEYLMAQAGL